MEIDTTTASALARCTAFDPPTEEVAGKKLEGPDDGWTLLNPTDVAALCSGEGAHLEHRGREDYHHVCASFGEWAFDAHDGSRVRCVAFLHYKIPEKANKLLGSAQRGGGAKVFDIAGADLLSRYRELQKKHHVHVWQRKAQREIAIDFCIGHGAPLEKKGASRSIFSRLLSGLK